jgi:hypothetical protein
VTPGLLVAPCSVEAARWAATRWHYAGTLPLGRNIKYGAWWDGEFRGAVVYARGNATHLGTRFGLGTDQRLVAELCRVAFRDHPEFTITAVVAWTLRHLHRTNPGLRMVVSFADPEHDHHGGIYQAGNWIYTGRTNSQTQYFYRGRWVHDRDFNGAPGFYGSATGSWHKNKKAGKVNVSRLPKRATTPKLRYVYPLDRAMRRHLASFAVPYESHEQALTT